MPSSPSDPARRSTSKISAADERLARARELEAHGSRDLALKAYLEILVDEPSDYEALIRAGVLFVHAGNLPHAHVVFAEAAKRHPDRSTPHAYLANVLLDLGDADGAVAAYETALRADPDDRIAHRGLAIVHERAGRFVEADAAWRRGFPDGALAVSPHRGEGEPVDVLLVTSAVGGNIPLFEILDDRVFALTTLIAESYGEHTVLPRGGVVFNAIGDADRCGRALERAERALAATDAPVVNPPPRVRATDRAANARRFAALEGVVAPRIAMYPREALTTDDAAERLRAGGFAFPLLLRSPGYHTGFHFVRVDEPAQLADHVAALPGNELLAIAFVDTCGNDGLYRKYRMMFVDGAPYPVHLAIGPDWKVHDFTAATAEDAAHRAEEQAYLDDPRAVLGEPAWAALERVARELALDYGGVDFALDRARRLVVFEANATMVIAPPGDERRAYRRAPVERLQHAVRAMLVRRAAR